MERTDPIEVAQAMSLRCPAASLLKVACSNCPRWPKRAAFKVLEPTSTPM